MRLVAEILLDLFNFNKPCFAISNSERPEFDGSFESPRLQPFGKSASFFGNLVE